MAVGRVHADHARHLIAWQGKFSRVAGGVPVSRPFGPRRGENGDMTLVWHPTSKSPRDSFEDALNHAAELARSTGIRHTVRWMPGQRAWAIRQVVEPRKKDLT